jgi:adenosylcobinamide-GDP ribazoletransferase
MNLVRREFNIFLSAVMFFSRLPVYRFFSDCAEYRRVHIRYLPLVGLLLGCMQGVVFFAGSAFLPVEVALVITMIAGIVFTGAFHEDGLADTADAIGGGYGREKVLAIMKDSRIGTFGTMALLSAFLLKFMLLKSIDVSAVWRVLIVSQTVSRLFPLIMVVSSEYVSDSNLSKSKYVATDISWGGLAFGVCVVILSLFLLLPLGWSVSGLLAGLGVLGGLFLVVRKYFEQIVGGYTGDILGAIQQIFELLFLLVLVVVGSW